MKRYNRCLKISGAAMILIILTAPVVFCAGTISDKGYYAVVLERREPMLGRSVDAVVFTRAGSTYCFIRRLDENYRLVLNAKSGSLASEVNADNLPAYDAMIKENGLVPRTIRDTSGHELAIVYCGMSPCYIDGRIRKDGSIVLDVRGNLFADPEVYGVLDRAILRK
jgi:hypothetical protein